MSIILPPLWSLITYYNVNIGKISNLLSSNEGGMIILGFTFFQIPECIRKAEESFVIIAIIELLYSVFLTFIHQQPDQIMVAVYK